jgi:hypothetical protein
MDYQEHFVFVFVMMPNERAQDLHQLDVLSVQLSDYFRLEVFREERQLLLQIDLGHILSLLDLTFKPKWNSRGLLNCRVT